MKRTMFFAVAIAAALLLSQITVSCGSRTKENPTEDTADKNTASNDRALNITVYLDLSDRIVRELTPSQTERDISIVQHVAEIFKKESLGPQLLHTRNHLKVMFYPTPNSSEIASIAQSLDVDLEAIDVKERRATLENLSDKFKQNLTQVYSQTIQDENWPGSDIWGFFDRKVVDQQCVKSDSRNILVILTDGYIFDATNKQKQGNSYNYILPKNLDAMESVITSRKGLGNLEVLMLEVNPYQQAQRTKMISLLEKWFKDMEVSNFVVADTDLPSNTNTVIDNFFNQ